MSSSFPEYPGSVMISYAPSNTLDHDSSGIYSILICINSRATSCGIVTGTYRTLRNRAAGRELYTAGAVSIPGLYNGRFDALQHSIYVRKRFRMKAARWPGTLWIVRHGESAGNLARDAAMAEGAERIALSTRDVDIALSHRGEDQARALGEAFAGRAEDERPEVILASPYDRARATASLFRCAGGAVADTPICVDERLREKEFGILDGLTVAGVATVFPDQAEFRQLLGKFYHRPPGGESWCDVIFRLRSLMDTIALHYPGKRVMIVAHQVVVLCLRYIIENLSEEQILAIDREGDVANCSVTEYRFDPRLAQEGGMALIGYNMVSHLEAATAPATATAEPERTAGVRG